MESITPRTQTGGVMLSKWQSPAWRRSEPLLQTPVTRPSYFRYLRFQGAGKICCCGSNPLHPISSCQQNKSAIFGSRNVKHQKERGSEERPSNRRRRRGEKVHCRRTRHIVRTGSYSDFRAQTRSQSREFQTIYRTKNGARKEHVKAEFPQTRTHVSRDTAARCSPWA